MIKEIIEKAKKEKKKVYIYAHKYPDGDAISSCKATEEYLKSQGIEAQYVVTTPIRSYGPIVGQIPVTNQVDRNGISLILDTNTINYSENSLFKNSKPEDTYVIDHHGKAEDSVCIEDELGVPSQNVIRNPNASSVCELLVNEFGQENITPQIANMLTLGLLTDTAKLKFIKQDTLQNLSKLIEAGADYERIISFCNRKVRLQNEVGLAQEFLKSKTFPIGDTFGIMLSLDNKEVDNLSRKFGVRSPQKKIFKMTDIENCSFTCMSAENTPGEHALEFRSTPIYGNFNVLSLAASHAGGGHHSASGCSMRGSQESIEAEIKQQVADLYSEQAIGLPQITLSEQDKQLSNILNSTERLTKGVTPETLERVDRLVKSGVNYEYVFKTFKSYKQFMLENEVLSRIPSSTYTQRKPKVNIRLSPQEIDTLRKKYGASEEEILETIGAFSNIDIDSATISLPNGKSTHINYTGNITKRDGATPRGSSGIAK